MVKSHQLFLQNSPPYIFDRILHTASVSNKSQFNTWNWTCSNILQLWIFYSLNSYLCIYKIRNLCSMKLRISISYITTSVIYKEQCFWESFIIWDKVFKSGLSKFFKGYFPQNLLAYYLHVNSSRPNPGWRGKKNIDFHFHTSLRFISEMNETGRISKVWYTDSQRLTSFFIGFLLQVWNQVRHLGVMAVRIPQQPSTKSKPQFSVVPNPVKGVNIWRSKLLWPCYWINVRLIALPLVNNLIKIIHDHYHHQANNTDILWLC